MEGWEIKLLCVLICNFIFQYVMFRAYVYMYACVYVCVCVPHTPLHYHICQIHCSKENTVCAPPLNSVTSLRLPPLYLVFHITNTLLTFGPTITYILVTLFYFTSLLFHCGPAGFVLFSIIFNKARRKKAFWATHGNGGDMNEIFNQQERNDERASAVVKSGKKLEMQNHKQKRYRALHDR